MKKKSIESLKAEYSGSFITYAVFRKLASYAAVKWFEVQQPDAGEGYTRIEMSGGNDDGYIVRFDVYVKDYYL